MRHQPRQVLIHPRGFCTLANLVRPERPRLTLREDPRTDSLAGVMREVAGAADQIKFARGQGAREMAQDHLAAVRRDFRRLALDTLREQTASDEEFRAEARELLGLDPP